MGLSISLGRSLGARFGGVLFHRATRRAKGKLKEKIAVAGASAVAGETAESLATEAGNRAEQRLDEDGNAKERWSLIGQFIPDSSLESIGEFFLQYNFAMVAVRAVRRAEDMALSTAESAAGMVSKEQAKRLRLRRMNNARRWNRVQRYGRSKKQYKKLKEQSAAGVDIGLAIVENVATGGQGIAGQAGARATRYVARQGLRRMARRNSRRIARNALRNSVGK